MTDPAPMRDEVDTDGGNHTSLDMSSAESVRLEADLLRQEHRLYHIVRNFFVRRHEFDEDDPRRGAVCDALIWRVLVAFAPQTAAAGLGISAVLGLMLAYSSNELMDEQNKLLSEQNGELRNQLSKQQEENKRRHREEDSERRLRFLERMYAYRSPSTAPFDPAPDKSGNSDSSSTSTAESHDSLQLRLPVADSRSRSEALLAFITIERDTIERDRLLGTPSDRLIDLQGALLQSVNATSYDLRSTDLRDAQFQGAILSEALLSDVDASGSNFDGARFYRADLESAKLNAASLRSATMQEGRCHGADFRYCDMQDCNLWGADFSNVNMQHAKLNGAILFNVNLTGANLDFADLTGASLEKANLTGVSLDSTILVDVNLSYAKIYCTPNDLDEFKNSTSTAYDSIDPCDALLLTVPQRRWFRPLSDKWTIHASSRGFIYFTENE